MNDFRTQQYLAYPEKDLGQTCWPRPAEQTDRNTDSQNGAGQNGPTYQPATHLLNSHSLTYLQSTHPPIYPPWPGTVAQSEACWLGMQAAPSSIPMSSTFSLGDMVIKTFLWPFSLFRWFKKSSCQLLVKECAQSTGKLARRLAQQQCG